MDVLSFTYLIKPNQNRTERRFWSFKKPKPNRVFENWNCHSTSRNYRKVSYLVMLRKPIEKWYWIHTQKWINTNILINS